MLAWRRAPGQHLSFSFWRRTGARDTWQVDNPAPQMTY